MFATASIFQISILQTLHDLQEEVRKRADDGVYIAEHSAMGQKAYQVIADAVINRDKDKADEEWEDVFRENKDALRKLAKIIDTDEEELLHQQACNDFSSLEKLFTEKMYPLLFETSDTVGNWNEIQKLDSKADKTVDHIEESLHKILESLENEIVEADDEFGYQSSLSRNIIYVILVVILIILIIFIYILINLIAVPLRKGVEFAGKVEEGDLTAKVDINQKDEIGDLASALRNMISKVRSTVNEVQESASSISNASSEVNNAAQQLNSGSQQINSSSQKLSEGATEQAASTEQV